jgi:Putative adhesin
MIPTRIVVLTVLSLNAGSGCATATHREPLSIDEPVLALNVDVGSGDVHIVGAEVSGASVVAKVQGERNHLGFSLNDGRLSLYEECNEDPCGVNIYAVVPAPIPMDLYTGSGDVRVEDALERVHVEAGSGDVEGIDIAGLDLGVKTGSGDIDLRVRAPAERVSVRAGSGDVRLTVPAGGYQLAVDTGSGDRSVRGIANDVTASSSIAVDTGSGDVRIVGR